VKISQKYKKVAGFFAWKHTTVFVPEGKYFFSLVKNAYTVTFSNIFREYSEKKFY
jgi:hypothetical protein